MNSKFRKEIPRGIAPKRCSSRVKTKFGSAAGLQEEDTELIFFQVHPDADGGESPPNALISNGAEDATTMVGSNRQLFSSRRACGSRVSS